MNYLKGITWLIASFIIGSLNDSVMKYMAACGFNNWQITFFRYFFSSLFLAPIILYKGKTGFKTSNLSLHVLRGGILTVAMLLWNIGISMVPLSTSTVMGFLVPIFALALAPFIVGESFKLHILFATLFCMFGAIIATDSFSISLRSSCIIFVVAEGLFAVLDLLYKKFISRDSLITTVFYSSIVPMVLTAVPAFSSEISLSIKALTLLILLGIGNSGLLYCILMAYSHTTITSLAPFRYIELVVSIALGYILFSEIPSLNAMLGAGIIIMSSIFLKFMNS